MNNREESRRGRVHVCRRWRRELFLLTILHAVAQIVQGQPTTIGVQRQVDSQTYPMFSRLVETSIAAVTQAGSPDVLVANWVYSNSTSNTAKNGVAASIDGGLSWMEFPQSQWAGDPMACGDKRTGTIWVGVANLGTNPGLHVAKWNGVGGTGFDAPVAAVVGTACDKAFMAAGSRAGQPNTTRLYVSYLTTSPWQLNLTWSDSLGSAGSWATPIPIPNPPAPAIWHPSSLPRIGPNGQLYIFTKDNGFGVYLIRSLSENALGQPVFDAPILVTQRLDTWSYSSSDTNDHIPGQFNAAPFTYGAVDPIDGTLYCIYFDTSKALCSCCPQVCTSWDIDLYLTKSTDQGSTWDTPHRILGNDQPPYDQFFAWLEVDTSQRLHLVYFDTRGTTHTDQDYPAALRTRYSWSTDGGATWADSSLCTIAPYWNQSPTPPTPAVWIADDTWYGEYIGLAVAGKNVYPIYPAPLGPGVDPPDSRIWTNIITWP